MHTGGLYGVQLRVAQPSATRSPAPTFEHHAGLPQVTVDGADATVLVGAFAGATSPARRDSDHLGVELAVRAGRTVVPLAAGFEHAVLALGPGLSVAGRPLGQGHLGYLGVGLDELVIDAAEATMVLLIGGEPFDEKVLMWWNYVARSRDEIVEAHEQWSNGADRSAAFARRSRGSTPPGLPSPDGTHAHRRRVDADERHVSGGPMPAITVEDTASLNRLPRLPEQVRQRAIRQVTDAPKGFEGEGFPVRRAFAGVDLAHLDPFIHLDQIGEVNYCPGDPKGTPWHPHRGFETVTYMMEGVLQHADSIGGGGVIRDGATQWMTAGKGILHIETPPPDVVAAGGWFHGLQLWVNLPSSKKWIDPRYQDVEADLVEVVTTPDANTVLRVIAGPLDDFTGPGSTHSPITMVHATFAPGSRAVIPWPSDFNCLVYVLGGRGFVGAERRSVQTGNLTVFGPGDAFTLEADQSQDTRTGGMEVLFLGGRPLGEPVAWAGPFVMNTDAEVRQAFDDFQRGVLGEVPRDHPLAPTNEVVAETDSSLD